MMMEATLRSSLQHSLEDNGLEKKVICTQVCQPQL